ncbi:MAG: MFS transporter [Formosimonas sp.]
MNPRAAQAALFSIFASFGLMVGLWAAAIPPLQLRLQLSADLLGASIFCFGMGAVCATFITPKYIERHQSRPVMISAGVLMWLVFPWILVAPSVAIFMLLLAILGFFCGMLDASMNNHAFTVEHFLHKPCLSMLHGGYSLGSVIGSALAAWLIGLSIDLSVSSFVIAALAIAALFWAKIHCYAHDTLESNDANNAATDSTRMPLPLIVIAALTAICFFSEGSIGDWAGLYLRDEKSANASQTALSMGAFATGMMLARFAGDRLRARFDTLRLLAASSLLAGLMVAGFLFAPNAQWALLALLVAGLGYANIVPLLFVRAAQVKGVSPARGVAFAAGMGYASLIGGPALVGYVAEHAGLTWAMSLVLMGTLMLSIEGYWAYRQSTVLARVTD